MSATDRLARIELARLRVKRLAYEARSCRDLPRLQAITAEMEVVRDSLYEIREEQLVESLDPPDRRPAWWRRLLP